MLYNVVYAITSENIFEVMLGSVENFQLISSLKGEINLKYLEAVAQGVLLTMGSWFSG